jgi:LmbE family N-acetylglucosaminyl deacetylase
MFSAGASLSQLVRTGAHLVVLTLFAGSPAAPFSETAEEIHESCGYPNELMATVRRSEDLAAIERIGADAQHAGFLDAIYRRAPDGNWLCRPGHDMFNPVPPAEPALWASVIAYLDATCDRLRPGLVLTCAAIGGHIDHLITRQCCEQIARTRNLELLIWEDLPYATGNPEPGGGGPHPAVYSTASAFDWAAKWHAVAAYQSQLRMLWPDGDDWQADLSVHARRQGRQRPAELSWRTTPASPTSHGSEPGAGRAA